MTALLRPSRGWPVAAALGAVALMSLIALCCTLVIHDRGLRQQLAVLAGIPGEKSDTIASVQRAAEQTRRQLVMGIPLGGVLLGCVVLLIDSLGSRRRRVCSATDDGGVTAVSVPRELLAQMSHELRTPLNAVLGASDLLRGSPLDDEQAELVATADRSGRQLLALVDGLLDLAELQGGRLHLEQVVFDLESELEGAVRMFARAAYERGLDLTLQVDSDLPDVLVGDPARLRQIVVALLSKALKFSEQGEILVVARELASASLGLRIEVIGTGTGGDATAHEQAEWGGSSGVGMDIASGLTRHLGGRIGVDSAPGGGGTYWLELPLVRASELQRHEYQSLLPLRGRRILLLTGSEELAMRASVQLLSQGCEVSLFSPARADDLAAAPDLGWDCVVVDADVAARVDGEWERQMPPAVVLGNQRVLHRGELVRLPVHKSDLLAAVQRACGLRQRYASDAAPPRRVLVAEDNAVNRRMVAKMLEALGCEVVLAADGGEAVQAWQHGTFDLVLMDYQMPVMDGPQAAQRIRAMAGDRSVPILAFTANTDCDAREACRAAGMDGYLPKPLRRVELERALAQWAPANSESPAAAAADEPLVLRGV